ncbi:MAG: hypothetical protein H6819_07310 [Phycisphaerales bacterium]|nr:hypothetical protein [Phycisphaerales bacterium]MCB9857698.1 hypothetical protein [Phycisphaerales bacterium]MCB9864787.1 hypothetical protein [Phycisphaerales bacterium]
MTKRFVCIATCLALCWCFGSQLNAGEPASQAPRSLKANASPLGQIANEPSLMDEELIGPIDFGAPRGVPCGPTVYDSLTLISGANTNPTSGTQLLQNMGDLITLDGTLRNICRVSVIWASTDGLPYNLTLRIYDGCPVSGATLPGGNCGALGAQIGPDFTVNVPTPTLNTFEEIEFIINPPLTVPDTIGVMFQTDSLAGNRMSLDAQVTVGTSDPVVTRCNSTGGNNGCNRQFGGVSNNVGLSVQAEAPAGSGACCDRNTGICTDVAGFGDCTASGNVFTLGMTCAQVTCTQFTGACCTEGRVCTDLIDADCATAGGTFLGNGTSCATSACPLECQTGGFGQVPDGGGQGAGNTIAVVSDRTRPLGAADNFVPVASGNITSAKWWGLYVDLGAGAACADGTVPDEFQITYYTSGSDGGPAFPGQIIAGPFSVGAANKVNSGFGGFGGFWEYSATHPPVPVQAGFCYWVEITNTSDTVCEWLWVVAPPGDSVSAQGAPNAFVSGDSDNDFDLGFCLDIEIAADGCLNALPLPGACCLNQANSCMDSDVDACGLAGGTFLGGFTTCATSTCAGACCTTGTNCQLSAAPIVCEQIGGVFQGIGTTCSPVNPCALSACCLDGVGTCSDLTPLDCEVSGGASFVGQVCADMPNCPSGEIVLAPVINCNSSYVTNNAALPAAGLGPNNPDLSCIGGGPGDGFGEFWVSFIATDSSAFISTANSQVADTIIEVFTDNGTVVVPDSCSEDISSSNFLSEVCIPTTMGTQYWILVASFDAASQGPITVDLVCPCPATCDTCPGDLNGDTKLDGADIQQFTRCLIGAEGNPDLCVCADMDDDGNADIADVAPFVTAILNGGFCDGFPLQLCEGGTNGQTPDFENALGSSSVPADGRVADNFDTPTGGTITEITWWGVYLGTGCPDTADNFTVTIHNDDGAGVPGSVVQSLTLQTPTRVATGRNLLGIADEFKYTLSGLSINLAPGCYWLHIGNEGSAACTWFWSTSNDGDAIGAFDPDGTGYLRVAGTDPVADDNDTAWCLTLTIGDNSTCFVPPPADDNCVDPQVITDGTTLVNLADGTDSTLAGCLTPFPFGDNIIHADLFFSYTASCTGSLFVDTCGTATDTRLAIYNTDCNGILGGVLPIECNDDHGEATEGDTGNTCPDQFSASLSIPVTMGDTFIIRVGTFGAAPQTGTINLNVNCAPAGEGACCVGVTCSDVTAGVTECDGLGGTYLGDGTSCATSVCGGACCLENGSCTAAIDGTDCIDNVAGGLFYWGDGVDCADVINAGACPPFVSGECVYQLVLFDSFGDGWNDGGPANTLDVFVNGVSAFGGPVTLPDGFNGFIFFTAPPGAVITTTYAPGDGFEDENAWIIFDAYGNVTCEDLGSATGPDQTAMRSCTSNACN